MTMPGVHFVKSAQRVLEVLEYFDVDRQVATVTDISRALSYPQSSASVLLRCLRQLGYLYYNRNDRTYRPTARAALLGVWAEDGTYRGGKMLRVIDAVAERLGETVMLSASHVDYATHHLHVRRGTNPNAVAMRSGQVDPILQSAPGHLILSSYPADMIKLALHRLNADEEDPALRVGINEKLAELQAMRERGWTVHYNSEPGEIGTVSVLMPRRRGGDRIALSVVAQAGIMRANDEAFARAIFEERDRIFSV
jgi:IclR family KDG regulon transcriptional repressor